MLPKAAVKTVTKPSWILEKHTKVWKPRRSRESESKDFYNNDKLKRNMMQKDWLHLHPKAGFRRFLTPYLPTPSKEGGKASKGAAKEEAEQHALVEELSALSAVFWKHFASFDRIFRCICSTGGTDLHSMNL